MSDLFARLARSGRRHGPAPPDGSVPFGIEISPLFALDAAELGGRVDRALPVTGPVLLS